MAHRSNRVRSCKALLGKSGFHNLRFCRVVARAIICTRLSTLRTEKPATEPWARITVFSPTAAPLSVLQGGTCALRAFSSPADTSRCFRLRYRSMRAERTFHLGSPSAISDVFYRILSSSNAQAATHPPPTTATMLNSRASEPDRIHGFSVDPACAGGLSSPPSISGSG